MTRRYPAMARMPGQMLPGTARMDQQMAGGGLAGKMGGDSAAMAGTAGR
jgi:hypothetical protein